MLFCHSSQLADFMVLKCECSWMFCCYYTKQPTQSRIIDFRTSQCPQDFFGCGFQYRTACQSWPDIQLRNYISEIIKHQYNLQPKGSLHVTIYFYDCFQVVLMFYLSSTWSLQKKTANKLGHCGRFSKLPQYYQYLLNWSLEWFE